MSASLLSTMTQAEVNSTLQILSENEVSAVDLAFFRRHRYGFAKEIAKAIKDGLRFYLEAIGQDEQKAVHAVRHFVSDTKILKDVYEQSQYSSVWIAVMEKLTNEDDIYHLIRVYSVVGREEASMVGARKLERHYLGNLRSDDGFQNFDALAWRRELVRRVAVERDPIKSDETV